MLQQHTDSAADGKLNAISNIESTQLIIIIITIITWQFRGSMSIANLHSANTSAYAHRTARGPHASHDGL